MSGHYHHHLTLPHLSPSILLSAIFSLGSIQAEVIPLQNNKPNLGRLSPTNTSRYTHHILVPE